MAIKLSKSLINSLVSFLSEKSSVYIKTDIRDHGIYLDDKILGKSYERVYQSF
jgi:hypothetical protein